MSVTTALTTIPTFGVGLGYRWELREGILANRTRIDVLEIIADNYLRESGALAALEELCALFPVIPHGVDLSIGSVMPLEPAYLRSIKRVSDRQLTLLERTSVYDTSPRPRYWASCPVMVYGGFTLARDRAGNAAPGVPGKAAHSRKRDVYAGTSPEHDKPGGVFSASGRSNGMWGVVGCDQCVH